MSHAPPPGPPPARRDSLEVAVPDEPPPAYEAVSRDETVQAGPSRMDFSGPPPLPDRFQNLRPHSTGGYSIPGVGVGYGDPGQGAQHGGNNSPSAPPPPGPPPPPRHPHAQHSSPTSPTSSQDASPTEHPVPGRALLHNGQLLVYPKGHYCSKCQNTGYKNGDARNPCSSDWRKYGKHYTGALAASFVAPRPGGNAGTVAATNYQRPLPSHQGGGGHQGHGGGHTPQHHQQGAMGSFPGQYRPPQQQNYRPQIRPHMYGPPAGALVVQPGDPRIGGSLCYRCGGSGRETSLFMFDDGPCWQCRGVGRVF